MSALRNGKDEGDCARAAGVFRGVLAAVSSAGAGRTPTAFKCCPGARVMLGGVLSRIS